MTTAIAWESLKQHAPSCSVPANVFVRQEPEEGEDEDDEEYRDLDDEIDDVDHGYSELAGIVISAL